MTTCETCGAPVWKDPLFDDGRMYYSGRLTQRKNRQTATAQEELEWMTKLIDQKQARVTVQERTILSDPKVLVRLVVECELDRAEDR